MPLIIFSGFPSSGKTTQALKLIDYLQEKKENVINISDDSLLIDRQKTYSNGHEEKKARGAWISAIERHLNKRDYIIADGLNYIKGFRYQLYCLARQMHTPHCIVHVTVEPDLALEWNQKNSFYSEEVMKQLMMRYEEPNAMNRWDSPLFTVRGDEEIPCQKIIDGLLNKKMPTPTQATVPKSISTENVVNALDKQTLEIIKFIHSNQQPQSEIKVPKAQTAFYCSRQLSMSELMRLRKQFILMNKLQNYLESEKIGNLFLDYLNASLQ